jgi:hypothetical protein
MKKERIDGLTPGRVYGRLCQEHPELEGLRIVGKRKYIAAHDVVNIHVKVGECVGCKRDREASKFRGTLHFGIDEKYGDTWQMLHGAIGEWSGSRRTIQ